MHIFEIILLEMHTHLKKKKRKKSAPLNEGNPYS